MEYTVKFKRVDNGKTWIAGNCKDGKYGPQIGMKKTPELKAYLDSVADGGWINFNLYAPDKPKSPASDEDLGDSIPF